MNETYAYTPYILPMLASAIFLAGLAIYAWKHRTVPGADAFAIQMLFCALWALFTAIEIAATAEPTKILWFRITRVTIPPSMAALLFFALEYANPGKRTSRRHALVLSALALFASAWMATDDLHHLFWSRVWFDGFVRYAWGPTYPIVVGSILFLPGLAILIFLRLMLRSRGVYRGQAFLLFTGNALPTLAFLFELTGSNPVAPLDPIILMLNLTGLLFILAIYRFGMMSIVPVGRDMAMEHMAEGVIILDSENRIADVNPAARAALALSTRDTMGRPALQVLAAYPDLSSVAMQEGSIETEISVTVGSQLRFYQVHASLLIDSGGFKLGRLISLRDVTEQKQAREQLLQQQRTVAILQERERLARELHDSMGQIYVFINTQGQTVRRLLARGDTSAADEYVARIIDVAREADMDIRESIVGLRVAPAVQGFFPRLAQYLERYEKNHNIHTELIQTDILGDGAFEPAVEVQLLRILQEALTNARKHADARNVQVVFAVQNEWICATVNDDGQGFDAGNLRAGLNSGFGLQFMCERAQEFGGNVAIHSEPGCGTQVVVQVPIGVSQARSG